MSTPFRKGSDQSSGSDKNRASGEHANAKRRAYTSADMGGSTAETELLKNIEGRRGHARTMSGDNFRTAVAGERPLLGGNVTFDKMYSVYGDAAQDEADEQASAAAAQSQKPRLKSVVRNILLNQRTAEALATQAMKRKHKRVPSSAQTLLSSIREDAFAATDTSAPAGSMAAAAVQAANTEDDGFFSGVGEATIDQSTSTFAVEDSSTDRLIAGAMKVEKLFDDDDASLNSADSLNMTPSASHENLPLIGGDALLGDHDDSQRQQNYGSATVQEIRRTRRRSRRLWRKMRRVLRSCCNPVDNLMWLVRVLRAAYFFWMSLPLFGSAWLLYYYFGNPELDFMPGTATVSWWFNFIGRHLLTLELARVTEWLVIDCCALGSRLAVTLFGPYLTLLAIQAKGWPFMLGAWATWDLFLLHGNDKFQSHWLFWAGIDIYSEANSGSYILSSELYLRVLLSMLLAGVAASFKRTIVAVYFGRRTFAEFKPRLEKILKESVLLSEVADLAEEADHLQANESFRHKPKPSLSKGIGSVKWFAEEDYGASDSLPGGNDDDSKDPDAESNSSSNNATSLGRMDSFGRPALSRTASGSFRVKDLLDRWEEPVNKLDKASDGSAIHDILKFRRALSYMDESHPFGESFGPATTRDECIASAHSVYYRLLKLTPDIDVLSNEVLSMLAQDEDGNEIVPKQVALKRLFRPDRYNQLPLLAFLQSCDTLYKKLRYFRASVGNASVIDHILEWQFDSLFAFVLFLVILTMLNFNPWPLLVSMSTLLVSFSFAMGASASKYIEGMLLISVRRPYDLGDRIVLSSSDGAVNPGVGCSWFVEDINLYATTLRYGQTNEVATVSNGTLAASRIVNCNRSPNAIVLFDLLLHIKLLEDENAALFVSSIEKYIAEHPRIWDCMILWRYDRFDADMEQVFCRIGLRHRNSWQDAGRILRDKGELLKFIHQLGDSMDVNFGSVPARRVIFSGGTLIKSGPVSDVKKNFKRDLLNPSNIHVRNDSENEIDNEKFMASLQGSQEQVA